MKKLVVLLASGLMLGLAFSVFAIAGHPSSNGAANPAVSATPSSGPASFFSTVQEKMRQNQMNILQEVKKRARLTKKEFEVKREKIKTLLQENQQEWRALIRERREKTKELINARRETLRNRLQEKIEANKQKIVERIYDRVNALNERMTDHYLAVVEKLEKVLEKIESRTAKAKLNGLDVSSTEEAINEAYEAIEKAREAIGYQAERVYAPDITTEENLRQDVGKIRKELHSDLVSVRELVKIAFMAVKNAAVSLAQIPKVDQLEVSTTTPPTQ